MKVVTPILDRWDQFLTWLFKGWGDFDATARPSSPHAIKARVDTKLAAWNTGGALIKLAPDPEQNKGTRQDEDTRPMPEPQNLDALIGGHAPSGPKPLKSVQPPPLVLNHFDMGWCNCTGMAHEAGCAGSAMSSNLDLELPSAPSETPAPEPAPTSN